MKSYTCQTNQGSFEFFADNKTLAVDHAKHHCFVMGWVYQGIKAV